MRPADFSKTTGPFQGANRGISSTSLSPARVPAVLAVFLIAAAASLVQILPSTARAQAPASSWPAVDPADLTLRNAQGAHAMILDFEEIVDDPGRVDSIRARIKVFDDEGRKYGDLELPYREKETEIQNIRARTISPEGTTLEFEGPVFDQLVVKSKKLQYRAKIFSLPDVQAGSIIEYSYQTRWKQEAPQCVQDPGKCGGVAALLGIAGSYRTATWDLQKDLFTRKAHFVLKPYPKSRLSWAATNIEPSEKPRTNPDGSREVDASNVPGLHKEEFAPPESTFRRRVEFYYLVGSASSPEAFWNLIGREEVISIDEFVSKHKRVDRLAAETIGASDSAEEKLRKLYARTQKIRNLSHEHERTEKERKRENLEANKNVDDVVEHGYGRGNEANYLFMALARAAGFNSSIVLVTGRDRGRFRKEVLDAQQLSAAVVYVHTPDQEYYLDPAEHLCRFPQLPWYEAGAGGIRLETAGGFLTTTPSLAGADAQVTRRATLHLTKEGTIQGKLGAAFTGQAAFVRRKEMVDEDAASRRKSLEADGRRWLAAGATVDLTQSEGWDDADAPLRAEWAVSIPSQTARTDTRLLLPVAVTVAGKPNLFQHSYRTEDVDLRFPYQELDEVTIELPEGYEVEALPTARKLTGPSSSYELSTTRQGKSLTVKRRLMVGASYYRALGYAGLRDFFSAVKTGDEDRAVLRKVTHAAQR